LREEIARLMSLQSIDRELRELEQTLSSIAGKVDSLRQETESYRTELTRLTEEEQHSAIERRRIEKEIAEGEARMRNKRMRMNQVRSDKESLAVSHELDALRENNQRLESELLALMEAADPRTARSQELGALIEAKAAELSAAEKDIAAQVEDLKVSIAKQKVDRDLMSRDIAPPLLQRYEMIFSRRAGLAVSEARDGACQGCRMKLPPQLFNEIQKHLQIHFCPNCQRILYFDAAARE
jgi:predicted  nucleic acid-binding Zn-ribbon protein